MTNRPVSELFADATVTVDRSTLVAETDAVGAYHRAVQMALARALLPRRLTVAPADSARVAGPRHRGRVSGSGQ